MFLKDLGWSTLKVKQGRSDDEVLSTAKTNGPILVTRDVNLAKRCRLQGVKVVELGLEEEARIVHQILQTKLHAD